MKLHKEGSSLMCGEWAVCSKEVKKKNKYGDKRVKVVFYVLHPFATV